jgi:hypothetical protein
LASVKDVMATFKRLYENRNFFRKLIRARDSVKRIRIIIKQATPSNILALVEVLRNLKYLPLIPSEKLQYCKRRAAIVKFLDNKTSCDERRSICLKKGYSRSKTKGQVGGILPLLPIIGSLGIHLLSNLFKK